MARDKRGRFLALAEARTQRVLEDLRLLGNLANKGNYDYTEAEARQIIRAVEKELETLKEKFAESARETRPKFRLKVQP